VVIAGRRTVVGMLRADRISASEQAPAVEVMQPGPTTVRAHEDLDATRQRMNEHHVAHLLVTTPDGTLIGVVDAADS
jgi:CBS domain-containing protein